MSERVNDISSSSAFVDAAAYSAEWTDIKLLQRRSHNVIHTATRYGRRFLLKSLTPEAARLCDYRLLQEKEFRLGIALTHPNIAATYALEEVKGVGRCIVQEYIDGLPMAQWLMTKPSLQARERVLDQLLDALDYLHKRQLVHHDLKSGNLLVTRHGANLKMIDFGLSDTDDSLSPVANDPQEDITAVGNLINMLFAHRYLSIANRCRKGRFTTVGALQRAIARHRRLLRIVPMLIVLVVLGTLCAVMAVQLFQGRVEDQRREHMRQQVQEDVERADADLTQLLAGYDIYNVESAAAWSSYCEQAWKRRDSIAALYAPDDPLHDEVLMMWNTRYISVMTKHMQRLGH